MKSDVVAVQETQLSKTVPNIPGFQPPVVVRIARGRTTGAAVVKGQDVGGAVHACGAPLHRPDRQLSGGDG